jgi:hypothetical protein
LNNDIAYVQVLEAEEERSYVRTMLIHKSGQTISGRMLVKPTKNDMQGLGSAITYARRYGLQAITGLPTEDDDGNHASKVQPKQTTRSEKIASAPDMTLEDSIKSKAKILFEDPICFQRWLAEKGLPQELSLATEMGKTKIIMALNAKAKENE